METFEINSLLRLLRSSIKSSTHPPPALHQPNPAASTTNFIASGQRFETLKTLRRQLRRHFADLSRSASSISFTFVQSIFDVLRQILKELVVEYFESHPQTTLPFGTKPSIRKASISVETVFAAAVQRNEILEIIQTVSDIVSKASVENLLFTESILKRSQNFLQLQEECYGKVFLPEVISLLGHESSDVQRFSIRFLLQYMGRTHNLRRFLEDFIKYGLESANGGIQFGALQAVGHLFVRTELRAENLGLLVRALGRLLVNSQTNNRALFYPTFVAMERLNGLLGGRRFFKYLQDEDEEAGGKEKTVGGGSGGRQSVVLLYENLQKRAPSPSVFWKNEGSFPAPPGAPSESLPSKLQLPVAPESYANYLDYESDHDFIEDTVPEHTTAPGRSHLPANGTTTHYRSSGTGKGITVQPVMDEELEQELAELEELDGLLATSGQQLGAHNQLGAHQNPLSNGKTSTLAEEASLISSSPKPSRLIESTTANPATTAESMSSIKGGAPTVGATTSQHRTVSFASPPTTSQLPSRSSGAVSGKPSTSPYSTSSRSHESTITTQPSDSKAKLSTPAVSTSSKATRRPSNSERRSTSEEPRLKKEETKGKGDPEKEEELGEVFDEEMAATLAPGLAGYTALDADSLANLDYIPTMKDYYHYPGYPYYPYDPLYRHSPLGPVPPVIPASHRLPPVVPPTAAAAAAGAYGSLHLLRFGIFPRALIYQALSTLTEEQFAAVQAIVRIVRDCPPEHLLLLVPHLDEFLTVFISQLLLDGSSNFKVILWTLDIIELLSERLLARLHPHMATIVLLLSRRLGDNRIVIRDSVIKVYHSLAQRYSPQEMLDLLFKHVSTFGVSGVGPGLSPTGTQLPFTSSAKLREELANRVTATVSTFPRGHLNLPKLAFDVAPLLVDRRAQVRLAALEAVACLAQALGPHKLGSLMTAVHSLDSALLPVDSDRLVSAIQARLARRSLPRTGPDGNVTYVLRVPGPAEREPWYYRRLYDADLEWIALGPSTPISNLGLLHTPTALGPVLPFGTEPAPVIDKVSLATKQMSTFEEERLVHQDLAPSVDSEDIPPPVRSSMLSLNRSPTREMDYSPTHRGYHRSPSRGSLGGPRMIDPGTMAGDQASFARNWADYPQAREVETRAHSLERSKTVLDRPFGSRQDELMSRMMRGESIDDAELMMDAQFLRKSSVESIEAWRQYFGRFKKQLAEMALNGNGNGTNGGRFGSRPNSGAVFYGSPIPPYGLTPAAYYYYYHNGLSHSYHDLSELQQENMQQIMKRSGFAPPGAGTGPSSGPGGAKVPSRKSEDLIDVSESPVKSPPPRKKSLAAGGAGPSWSAKYRAGRSAGPPVDDGGPDYGGEEGPESTGKGGGGLSVDDGYPLERSVSMPAIPGSSSDAMMDEMMMDARGGPGGGPGDGEHPNVISDEVIQELGMWEQVIQEEKKEGPGKKASMEESMEGLGAGGSASGYSGDEYQGTSEEEGGGPEEPSAPRYSVSGPSVEQGRRTRTPSPSEEIQEARPISETKPQPESSARKASMVPVVTFEQPTPNLSAGTEPRYPVAEEETQQKITRRESVPRPPVKQDSIPATVQEEYSGSEEEPQAGPSGGEEAAGPSGDQTAAPGESTEAQPAPEAAQAQPTAAAAESAPGEKPKSSPKSGPKSGGPSVSKTGIPGPPSRRLSRIPQQLYIKTTPAIPVNANIQHILGNVARTEGPFETPNEAVKAAVIALHDNAWTTKVEGMLAVVRLATFHPHYLIRDQHQIALHLVAEIRNLRSTVARSAIFTIGELFSKLKSQIEPEQDILVQALMYKVGENSVFIREDIDRALQNMIDKMPQTRSALALITYGSNHRNTYVRRTSAQFLSSLVEKMGAMKVLLGPRDIAEHLLPAAARFIQDPGGHTRYFGRRIFAVLLQHPLFDKLLRRHISPGTYRNISGMLETIKRRGVGDRPADLYSPMVQPKDSDPRRLVVVGGENK